ncbi:MAG: hypothetical protein U0R24_11390 [Solirubrobacterales bacterium]
MREAAKVFRRWPIPFFIDDAAFGASVPRPSSGSYVDSIGMELSSPAAVKSTHYEAACVIGDPVHVAHGPLPGATREAGPCAGEDPKLSGWIEMIVDVSTRRTPTLWAGSEDERGAKKREIDISGTASAICAWKVDEGQRGRRRSRGVSAFVGFGRAAARQVRRAGGAGHRRPGRGELRTARAIEWSEPAVPPPGRTTRRTPLA